MIDPLALKKRHLPLVVLVDDRRGWLGWLIKAHSKGNYSHIMEMHEPGFVASQDLTGFKEKSIEDYMKPRYQLKFWRCNDITSVDRLKWANAIHADLQAPWKRRRYDYLGILGHLLGIPWLNNPHIKYCVERVADNLRNVLNMTIPKHQTPSGLNTYFNMSPEMEVLGRWYED